MFLHHRFAVGLCVAGGVVALALGLHAASAPPPGAGASFSWGPPPTPSASTDANAPISGAPIPTASPTATPPATSVGGVRLPLSRLFQQLNSETENTAVGQFSILRDLGDAIRDRIVGFLQWVSAGR